jgi:hypothetical protein
VRDASNVRQTARGLLDWLKSRIVQGQILIRSGGVAFKGLARNTFCCKFLDSTLVEHNFKAGFILLFDKMVLLAFEASVVSKCTSSPVVNKKLFDCVRLLVKSLSLNLSSAGLVNTVKCRRGFNPLIPLGFRNFTPLGLS